MNKKNKKLYFRIQINPDKSTASLKFAFPPDFQQQMMRLIGSLVSARSLLLITVVSLLWLFQVPETQSVVQTFIDLFALISQ